MYNAALSGWTVADGAQGTSTTLRVKRLNGFTTARRPTVSGASPIRFDPVSPTNPLVVTITGVTGTRNVIGFVPDVVGDEVGPGTLTLDAVTGVTVADRAAVYSYDRTNIVRVGGGNSVDSIGASDTILLASIRQAVARFWQNNVPAHADGRFHAHADPDSISQFYDDAEFQRLNTSLPDYVIYRQFALGEILNTVFLRNTECPVISTVQPYDGTTFSADDNFAGELYNTGVATGVPIHRVLVSAQGGIFEYYSDLSQLITDASINCKIADPRIVNNGIEVMSDRIQLIIRAPQNRLQDQVATSWKFIGDWPVRTDAATGDSSRFKRFIAIEHGAA